MKNHVPLPKPCGREKRSKKIIINKIIGDRLVIYKIFELSLIFKKFTKNINTQVISKHKRRVLFNEPRIMLLVLLSKSTFII